jgi:hypothetical protein
MRSEGGVSLTVGVNSLEALSKLLFVETKLPS